MINRWCTILFSSVFRSGLLQWGDLDIYTIFCCVFWSGLLQWGDLDFSSIFCSVFRSGLLQWGDLDISTYSVLFSGLVCYNGVTLTFLHILFCFQVWFVTMG